MKTLLLVFALLLFQITCYLAPHLWPGRFGMVLWMIGGDRLLWWGVGAILLLIMLVWAATHRPMWTGRRCWAALSG
jgi:hypothetical protein